MNKRGQLVATRILKLDAEIRENDPDAFAELGVIMQNIRKASVLHNHLDGVWANTQSLITDILEKRENVSLAELRKARTNVSGGVLANERMRNLTQRLIDVYKNFYLTTDHPSRSEARKLVQELQKDLAGGTRELNKWQSALHAIEILIEDLQQHRTAEKKARHPSEEPHHTPAAISSHRCACGKIGYATDDEGVWWCKKDAHARGLLERPKIEEEETVE